MRRTAASSVSTIPSGAIGPLVLGNIVCVNTSPSTSNDVSSRSGSGVRKEAGGDGLVKPVNRCQGPEIHKRKPVSGAKA